MALQMNYYHAPMSLLVYNAYWRINPINGLSGGKNKITFVIQVFKSAEEAHLNIRNQLGEFIYTFTPNISTNASNFVEQAYKYAKTLPQFSGAVDI